jgi:hypothetical protein
MKVSNAIKYLSEYNPDEEIFIAWWDKEYASTGMEHIFNGEEIPAEVWSEAISDADNKADYWSELAGEALCECVKEAYETYKEGVTK